jgi:glutamate synthase (NADPH) small chain
MTDPRGFLTIRRRVAPYRPPALRLADHREVAVPPSAELAVEQAGRCMGCGVPFCHSGCPLGNVVPDWNDLVHRGRWREAFEALERTNPFPELTGKLCPAPCEEACVLALNDDPVTIKQIELAIVDRAFHEGWVVSRPPAVLTGRRIAVVGSGPAGMAAAQRLARRGHSVTVFERDERPGGLLRFGIPDYKLEKWIVERRIEQLEQEGVKFVTGAEVGAAITLDELRAANDAVLLAAGAQRHRDLAVDGRDLAGIGLAMPYLAARNRAVAGQVNGHHLQAHGKRVAILGGGDTSADCLGNALREGAMTVTEIAHGAMPPQQRDPLATWPAWPKVLRTHPVHHEGGERRWSFETVRFEGRGGRLTGIRGMGPGGEERIEADMALLAIGFDGIEPGPLYDGVDVSRGTVATRGEHATSLPGVFAAGDCVLGADLIVTALAQGLGAARAIDAFVGQI